MLGLADELGRREKAAHNARLEAEGVDPSAFEGEDGPGNEAWQRAQALQQRVQAEIRKERGG